VRSDEYKMTEEESLELAALQERAEDAAMLVLRA
jgi:hypothetical protein